MYAVENKKARQREADRRYRMRHPDRLRERARKWRLANPGKRKAQKRRHYARHRAEILAEKREYYVARRPYAKLRALWAISPEAYAKYRAAMRVRGAKRCVLAGRFYKPRFSRRIPDWVTFGHVVDVRSPWLVANLTPAQRAYARELAIEKRFH